ncbi:MAG: hypothetical protein M1837_006903 [Sclerophora amabilis]|nr:MAG: hypothetical protein M1837_006903 [Sclerophora amabilis]
MSAPPFKVKALYEYSSPHDDDLHFPGGQIITVTEEEDADWYYGEYTDSSGEKREGIFPRNFAERYEPEMPPRPVRSNRPKKDAGSVQPPLTASDQSEAREAINEPAEGNHPQSLHRHDPPQSQPTASANKQVSSPVSPSSERPPQVVASKPAMRAPPPGQAKPEPAAADEKSTSGSFRDRIAAFNKPAAPPIAPFKPSGLSSTGGSGFIKKPFVAPPPSKDAYVPPPRQAPPQKMYQREEEPSLEGQHAEDVNTTELMSSTSPGPVPDFPETGSSESKTTSLKDRIALLQRQQMEQAARQAEGGQKKEKAKRPSKVRTESTERTSYAEEDYEGEDLQRISSGDTTGAQSVDTPQDEGSGSGRPNRRKLSREPSSAITPTIASRDFPSDANDADQSAAGETTEDAEENSTGRDDSDDRSRPQRSAHRTQRTSAAPIQNEVESEEDNTGEEDEPEEVDPETKRRMEIRERMAKMSGGMGMHGIFGGGMPPQVAGPGAKKKQTIDKSDRKSSAAGDLDDELATSNTAPVPMMPIPGMARPASPDQDHSDSLDEGMTPAASGSNAGQRNSESSHDVEGVQEDMMASTQRTGQPPPIPQGRPVPAPPAASERGPPPPVPNDRPVPPPPPTESRPLPPPPPVPMSPSAGSESDDEMSLHAKRLSLKTSTTDESLPDTTAQRPVSSSDPPNIPSRPGNTAPLSPSANSSSDPVELTSSSLQSATSPTNKRSSRAPPIPGTSPMIPPPSQARPPPPPPPTAAPPSRKSTSDSRPMTSPKQPAHDESDVEVTEYEGDYDTDIAPGATHKDALKAHSKEPTAEPHSEADAQPGRSPRSAVNSQVPPIPQAAASRPVPPPPPPPTQPPKGSKHSMDMPRAAPPPVPPTKKQTEDDEYDPFRYAPPNIPTFNPPTNADEEEGDLYSASPRSQQPRATPPAPPGNNAPGYMSTQTSARPQPRQSLDVQRTASGPRRSMEQGRPSGEHGHIAMHADLGEGSQWWTQPKSLPPTFQNRKDILHEFEESKSSGPSGQPLISKEVYILFHDYSQTIVTATFDPRNIIDVNLEQRQEPPPQRLRQDQLEDAHIRFGQKISEEAASKQNAVVGDGNPQSLVLELLRPFADALLPVGTRAYGAAVYANLANASVQQNDEIRPGDIISFRNAKFQGHRGTMHQKYSAEVGKPDHVGVVVDWDGTKKKVRAWEQGRESKKVKMESFKLGDLRSGEVKIWRVMARGWVGWGGQN